MKNIKSFSNFLIIEKYSLPNSVDLMVNEIVDFTWDKFVWWFGRKGLANYSEIHNIILYINTFDDIINFLYKIIDKRLFI